MANKKAAVKAFRQSEKRHIRNKSVVSEIRTVAKKARQLIADLKVKEADLVLRDLESKLYRAAKSKIIKKETASRQIGRMRISLHKAGKAPAAAK
jgi:small subunit ribosomal protein S20